ncbi:hypothetical protein C7212DRAFT_341140 [Tuber magnatum]|uniref:Uncharacterized protein n=1 Tax=Tuber magnatum TaxID=42249 RepID=A0A317SZX8_9PEZI|nr:hypothetical protein C7212DRAFT_341140 [Tuber magnatum]
MLFDWYRHAQELSHSVSIALKDKPKAEKTTAQIIQVGVERKEELGLQWQKRHVMVMEFYSYQEDWIAGRIQDWAKTWEEKQFILKREQEIGKLMSNWYEDGRLELEVQEVISGLSTQPPAPKMTNTITSYLISDNYDEAILEGLELLEGNPPGKYRSARGIRAEETSGESDQESTIVGPDVQQRSYKRKGIHAVVDRDWLGYLAKPVRADATEYRESFPQQLDIQKEHTVKFHHNGLPEGGPHILAAKTTRAGNYVQVKENAANGDIEQGGLDINHHQATVYLEYRRNNEGYWTDALRAINMS